MGRGRPPKENKKTNAERCRLYRMKHKETYKADDALRKRNFRQKMKLNPAENKLRLQREAAAKRELRLRKKLEIQIGKISIYY